MKILLSRKLIQLKSEFIFWVEVQLAFFEHNFTNTKKLKIVLNMSIIKGSPRPTSRLSDNFPSNNFPENFQSVVPRKRRNFSTIWMLVVHFHHRSSVAPPKNKNEETTK